MVAAHQTLCRAAVAWCFPAQQGARLTPKWRRVQKLLSEARPKIIPYSATTGPHAAADIATSHFRLSLLRAFAADAGEPDANSVRSLDAMNSMQSSYLLTTAIHEQASVRSHHNAIASVYSQTAVSLTVQPPRQHQRISIAALCATDHIAHEACSISCFGLLHNAVQHIFQVMGRNGFRALQCRLVTTAFISC